MIFLAQQLMSYRYIVITPILSGVDKSSIACRIVSYYTQKAIQPSFLKKTKSDFPLNPTKMLPNPNFEALPLPSQHAPQSNCIYNSNAIF